MRRLPRLSLLRLRMLLVVAGQVGGSEIEGWYATLGNCLLQVLHEPEEVRHRVHNALQLPLLPYVHGHLHGKQALT